MLARDKTRGVVVDNPIFMSRPIQTQHFSPEAANEEQMVALLEGIRRSRLQSK